NLPAAALFQNSPNPFNPTTVISFELLKPGHVRMDIFNVSGVRVRTVVDGHRDMGHHQVEWDGIDNHGADVTSGVYFYRLTLDGLPIATRKMTLLK
ncbi:MAG: T9SS type A sorting domain-containing protein, partial [Candidatus Krumholzibacteriota bacterium]|nr:T9SS type A sorting domain-containing protein [Candidatus Krumholzibacteriota bacterium]